MTRAMPPSGRRCTAAPWWCGVLTVLLVAGSPQSLLAWNDAGHRGIAVAAARQMPAELRERIRADLRQHPRYAEDFEALQPPRVRPLSEAEWLFAQAAIWPDLARSFAHSPARGRMRLVERYHRGRWHYINFPLYRRPEDARLAIPDPARQAGSVPRRREPGNVLAALRQARQHLYSRRTDSATRGLWVAWSFHLLADAHQPLHATALFSVDRWPRGDRGGNDIVVAGATPEARDTNLHAYWDDLLADSRQPAAVHRLARSLGGAQAGPVKPEAWLRASRRVAEESVYGPLLKAALEQRVVLSKRYQRRARRVARSQAKLAASRTAAWFAAVYSRTELDQR